MFFSFLNSRGPRNKARIGPKKLDVHTAKSEPAGGQCREKQHFPQSHHYEEDFDRKGEETNRSNKELWPKSPHPGVGASEPALCRTTYAKVKGKAKRLGHRFRGGKEVEFGVLALEELTVYNPLLPEGFKGNLCE